jgi:outer membrane protein TolC
MKKLLDIAYILPVLLAFVPAGVSAQHVVTLAECQELAVEHDPGIRAAQFDLQAALAQRAEARWEYVPRVSLNAAGYYALNPLIYVMPQDILSGYWADVLSQLVTDAAGQAGINPWYAGFKFGWTASAMVLQPVFAGGRIVNGNRLASLGVQAGELQLSVKRRESAASVEEKYRLGVSLQEKMQTLEQAAQLLDSLERDASAAVDAGLIADTDLLQVRMRQRELASGRVQLRSALKLVKMDLFNAIGFEYAYLDLDSYILEGDSFGELAAPEHYLQPDDAQYMTEESRLLAMQVESERLQKKMAVGEYLPQISIGAGYGYHDLNGAGRGRFNGVGFATVQIPITGIGKAAARARRFDSQVEKAQSQQDYYEAQLALQLHQKRLAVETAWEQLGVATESVAVARDAAEKLKARYGAGQVTMSDLLQAELTLRQAEEERIDKKMEYNLAVNSYLRRCGKL